MEYFVQTTLSGIAALGNLQFHAGEGLVPLGNDEAALAAPDSSWFTFQHMSNFKAWNDNEDCAPAWTDPRNDLLAALNEIMFRVGVYTAQNFNETYLKSRIDPGLAVNYNTTGIPLTAVQVFHTDFAYFIGAAVVELVCILTIMYTFYGFWRLGRDRTFSPLEIAKVSKSRGQHIDTNAFTNEENEQAFDSPLLSSEPHSLNGRKLAKACGTRAFQYSKAEGEDEGDLKKRLTQFKKGVLRNRYRRTPLSRNGSV